MDMGMAALGALAALACGQGNTGRPNQDTLPGSFGYDARFLNQYHPDAITLEDEAGKAKLIVLPAYQGRVMTSTATGDTGTSFGWINHALIASGTFTPHMNAFGGEERFWLGPEGGQFSIYFPPGADFNFEHWQVPAYIDTIPFKLVRKDKGSASFEKDMQLTNQSGTSFQLTVHRTVTLLPRDQVLSHLSSTAEDIEAVGFETDNQITNTGSNTWEKQSGMLSIWILSMLRASPSTTILIPWKGGTHGSGPTLTDDYFGKVPSDRLRVTDAHIFMAADGNHRGKIGIPPGRALPRAASYDSASGVLTIAQFTLPTGARDYVNSQWKQQDDPFRGDAVNAYNDGPIDGKQMGKFYELESSSPAAALAPGQTLVHKHRTLHVKGPKASIDRIARQLLGVGLEAIHL